MRFRILILSLFLMFHSASKSQLPHRTIPLNELKPVVLLVQGQELLQYWELEDSPQLWSDHCGPTPSLDQYKISLKETLGARKMRKAIQKEASQATRLSFDADTIDGDKYNARLVHQEQIGKVRPINFIEAQLLNYQANRFPLLYHPTEFHGFIITNNSLKRVRIYFAASDQPWPPKPTIIIEALKRDLQNGWQLLGHLHNHYEPASNNYIGIMAPSLADVQYYKWLSEDFQLQKALITNGFTTLELKQEEFSRFKSH